MLFCLNISYSQNNYCEVEYLFKNNSNYTETKAKLIFNDTSSVFKTFLKEDKEVKPELKENNVAIGGALVNTYQENYLLNKKLYSYEALDNDIVKISEDTPSFIWNIGLESKRIGKNKCNKATTSFRGRNYIAWYASEIPCNFGPWKFSGLPGLIMSIEDETQTYSWQCISVKFPTNNRIEIEYTDFINLTLKEYFIKSEESMNKLRLNPTCSKFSKNS